MSDSFKRVLEARRGYFNARFAERLVTRPDLDGDAFLNLLKEFVAPLVDAVGGVNPDATLAAGQSLYDVALELFAEGHFGANPVVARVWRELLPRLGRFLAEQPQRVPAAVVNAAYNVSQTPGARADEWIGTMVRVAPLCEDADELLRAGQVAAWRAGMAQYRAGALDVLRGMDAPLAREIFGLRGDAHGKELAAALNENPWLDPARPANGKPKLEIVKRVGAFRGFGGTFIAPPKVIWTEDGFVASDGEGEWLVMADAFGATLHRTRGASQEQVNSPFTLNKAGQVSVNGTRALFPELADATSWAANEHTLAVTTGLTHAVLLVAVV